jgi:hypothetical protein
LPPVAILDENPAGEVAVNVLVFIAVSIEHNVLHNNVVHVFSGKDGEDSRSRGIFFQPKILFGQPV